MLFDATLMMRRRCWYHLPGASSTYVVAAAAKEKMRSTSGLDVIAQYLRWTLLVRLTRWTS